MFATSFGCPSNPTSTTIRELWKRHSLAEDKRDVAGLLSTLTEDCVYEIVGTEHAWHGHEGAVRFYVGLLGAFPDIDFGLTDIVIGPQGVCEAAQVTATHAADWLGYQASGRRSSSGSSSSFPGTAPGSSSGGNECT